MNVRNYKRFTAGLAAGLSIAAMAAPTAPASPQPARPSELTYIQAPGGVYGYVTIPSELARIRHPGSVSDLDRFIGFRGGPGGVSDVGVGYTQPAATADGFAWRTFMLALAGAAGFGLAAAALILALRRRRTVAHV